MGEIQPTTPKAGRASARLQLRVVMLVADAQRSQVAAQLAACLPATRLQLVDSLSAARTALLHDGWALVVAQWQHPAALKLLEEAPEGLTRVLVTPELSQEVLEAAQGVAAVLCTLDQLGDQLLRVLAQVTRGARTQRLHRQRNDFDSQQLLILERLATGAALEEVLEQIVHLVEQTGPGLCSILLLDPEARTLRHGAAPNLPAAFMEAIDGSEIGPTAGSCGSAAYTGQAVFVRDIASHPYWVPYRQHALANGLRACWSTPVLAADGRVLATFAVYYKEPRDPTPAELRRVASASHLAAIAITRRRNEDALRLGERRYLQLLETSHEGVLVLDLAGRITFANPRAAAMLGTTPEELIGTSAHDLAHPTERARVEDVLTRRRAGVSEQYELHCARRDGSDLWTIVAASPITDESGQVVGMLKMLTDISERRAAEQRLMRSELELRALFESAAMGLALVDAASRPARFNKTLARMLGYDPEELHEIPLVSLVHPDDLDLVRETRNQLDEGRSVTPVEIRMLRKTGEPLWLRVCASRFAKHLAPTDMVGVAVLEDISEQRRAQAKIAEQAALLERAHDAIVLYGLRHGVRFWNQSAERLYGYTRDEAQGKSVGSLLFRDRSQLVIAERELLANGAFRGELRHHAKDGREVVVDASWTLLYDDQGQPESVLAIHTDATEKKKLEAQVMLAQRMESLGTLAGGIAHDFNNILAAIRGYLDLAIQALPADSPAQELLAVVDSATDRAVGLVQQILTFSRRKPAKRVPCSLEPVVDEVLRLLRATLPRMVQIETEYAAGGFAVLADATQLHQVLMNLGTNAAQALGGHGTITVRLAPTMVTERLIGVASEGAPGAYMRLTVEDDGSGMDADTLAHIFDPFFTTKAPGAGTGLGLSVVLGIVKDHGGVLRVESKPTLGTRFDIYLPEAPTGAPLSSARAAAPSAQGQGQRLLCVDDETTLLRLEQTFLENLGYRVDAMSDPVEALTAFRKQPDAYAVLVTDLAMPEMSGIELAAEVRGLRPNLPIILCSGYVGPQEREQARGVGIETILPKPDFLRPLARELVRALQKPAAN